MTVASALVGGRGPEPLSPHEARQLARLEEIVEHGLSAFLAVAAALVEIRDQRLYRATHPTFESYVRERFGLARRTAYGYLEAAVVAANVPSEAHDLSLSHLRALAPLAPDDQRVLAPIISPLAVAEARRIIKAWRAQQRAQQPDQAPPPIPDGTYRTVVADPPWRFEHDWGDGLAADQYRTLGDDEIAELPITEHAAHDSHLYLWTPVAKVPTAVEVCAAWGFRYHGLLTWVKPGLGLGTYWRVSTEHVVFGVRGRLRTQPNLRNWFEAGRTRHSAKPDAFYELVEQASPGPYLDLFARRPRSGWTSWGDEITTPDRAATG
jgi:N6-adenosine-specific RNA methylase IME4